MSRASSAQRARSDIAQQLQRVGGLRNEHCCRCPWKSKTLPRQLLGREAVTRACGHFAKTATGSVGAAGRGLPKLIAIIGAAVCGYWPKVPLKLASTAAPFCIRFAVSGRIVGQAKVPLTRDGH